MLTWLCLIRLAALALPSSHMRFVTTLILRAQSGSFYSAHVLKPHDSIFHNSSYQPIDYVSSSFGTSPPIGHASTHLVIRLLYFPVSGSSFHFIFGFP